MQVSFFCHALVLGPDSYQIARSGPGSDEIARKEADRDLTK